MIKKFIRWLFAKEFDAVRSEFVKDARELLEEAKKTSKRQFIRYDRFDLLGENFLLHINPIVKNKYLLCWLNERKYEYERLIKYGSVENRDMNIGRAMAMDELFKDLEDFELRHAKLLEEKENAKQDE